MPDRNPSDRIRRVSLEYALLPPALGMVIIAEFVNHARIFQKWSASVKHSARETPLL
jgi:hypothetical protein